MTFGCDIQGYKEKSERNFRDLRDEARPCECPNPQCLRKCPLYFHKTYYRKVYGSLTVDIPVFRCPDCGITVSILPSFLTRYKHYALTGISQVFYLYFVIGMNVPRIVKTLMGATCSTVYRWLKDWSIECRHLLLDGFVKCGIAPAQSYSGNTIKDWMRSAFSACRSFVFPDGTPCNRGCFVTEVPECVTEPCGMILPGMQVRIQSASPPLWPFRNNLA